MTPLRPTNIRIDSELLDGLQKVLERDGVSVSEQIRRAIRLWLKEKGVKVKTASRRASTRRKA